MSDREFTFSDWIISEKVKEKHWLDYFEEHLGKRRLQDVCRRMAIRHDRDLTERDLAKIIVCAADVKREDIQEILQGEIPPAAQFAFSSATKKSLSRTNCVEDLDPLTFHELYMALSKPFSDPLAVDVGDENVEEEIYKAWHFAISSFKFDPYWFTKKRLHILFENHTLSPELYYERIASFYASCEDLEVGCYIPAPTGNVFNYYRVSAQLITGSGQVGMVLKPATTHMDLPVIRVTRGTPASPAGLDVWSHIETDMEPEIGSRGYRSGIPYQEEIDQLIQTPYIELGYSIGGTIAQWRVAHNPEKVSSLWLYKSPGVPRQVWEAFNRNVEERNTNLDIHIFSAKRDFIDLTGEHLLGYKAPPSVSSHLYQMVIPRPNPHRYGFVDPEKGRVIKVDDLEKEAFFAKRQEMGFVERARKQIGKFFVFPFSKIRKVLSRLYRKTRAHKQRGLWYECPEEGPGITKRFVPDQAPY